MAIYSYGVRKHVRDDMYKTERIEFEIPDTEFRNLKNDDNEYSKNSAYISAKLGEQVHVTGFPNKVNNKNIEKEKKQSNKKQTNKKSFWRPMWAIPFKFIWLIIKFPFWLIFKIMK